MTVEEALQVADIYKEHGGVAATLAAEVRRLLEEKGYS